MDKIVLYISIKMYVLKVPMYELICSEQNFGKKKYLFINQIDRKN